MTITQILTDKASETYIQILQAIHDERLKDIEQIVLLSYTEISISLIKNMRNHNANTNTTI